MLRTKSKIVHAKCRMRFYTFLLPFTLKQMLLQMLQFLSVKRYFKFIHKIDSSMQNQGTLNTLKLIDQSVVTRRTSLSSHLVRQDGID